MSQIEDRLRSYNFSDELQPAIDEKFGDRAAHIFGNKGVGLLASRILLKDYPVETRQPGDVTLLDSYFLPADTDNTQDSIDYIKRHTSNYSQISQQLRNSLCNYGISNERTLVLVPHIKLADLVLASALFTDIKQDHEETAESSYIYLGRMIGYITIRKLNGGTQNIVSSLMQPFGNIIQVFPYTSSTQDLRTQFEKDIEVHNGIASAIQKEHELSQHDPKAITKFIAPTGTEMKKTVDDGLELPKIDSRTFNLLRKEYYKNDSAIVFAGIGFSAVKSLLLGKSKMTLQTEIFEPGVIHPEAFDQLIVENLAFVAQKITGKKISYNG